MRQYELLVLVGVVLGWLATHFFSEARERRKEVRAQIDKLVERLIAITKSATSFHTSDAYNEPNAWDLLGNVDRLERILNRLWLAEAARRTHLIVELRRAISLNNFEAPTFVKQQPSSEIVEGIALAAREIEDYLEERYLEEYPARFPYIMPSGTTILLCLGMALLALLIVMVWNDFKLKR